MQTEMSGGGLVFVAMLLLGFFAICLAAYYVRNRKSQQGRSDAKSADEAQPTEKH